jgi:ribonuclease E
VTSAVADFDGYSPEPAPQVVEAESMAPQPEQHAADRRPQEVAPTAEAETAQEAERAAARRRSTVREKVSFMVNAQPDAAAPVSSNPPQPPTAAPAPAEPASEATDGQPRRAGWWSRRFGNGE